MSKEQCVSCSRSASDGNLADAEDDNHEKQYEGKLGIADNRKCEIENRRFCTLPRLPYRRKSSRRKIKEIKVDVPFNASDEFRKDAGRVLPSSKKEEKKKSEHRSILSKLFRRHTTAAQTPVSPITCGHTHAKSNPSTRRSISYLMSASNTDIRSHMIISESSDYQEYFKDKTPAVCGIKNHGNTCFMNAVVQCLSNTDFFAEYLVMDQYKVDFHRRNKIHSKKFGTRGEVTEQLAIVLKSLWSCQYCTDVSQKFKTLVAKYGRQYEGTDQHDAQEFLLWLLDKVHEDLNTATKQKYKKPKNSYGRPDEDVAAETLANHLRCNNSFVHDLFQGQFRSSLSCPGCCRYSNTFDPYLCVSLPVPHHQTIPVIINLVPFGEDVKAIKLGLTMDSQASIKELCEKLSSEYNVAKQRILVTEISQGKFLRTFRDFDIMATLPENEVYAIELPSLKSVNNADGEYLTLVIINQVNNGTGGKNEMFWRPIVVQVLREATFKEIQKRILTAMGSIIKDKLCLEKSEPLFQLLVIDDVPDQDILPYSVDHPLYMPVVDQVLMLCDGEYSKCLQHLKLAAEWSQNLKESIIVDELCIEEQASVAKVKEMHSKIPNVSLYECFNLYFTEEKLDLEDAWMCPYCHQRLQGIKQLSLWTVPDVFIVHLKRFRQSLCQRTKVTTLVEFPNLGLDMNFYIAKRNHGLHHNVPNGSMGSLAFWSPWKRPSARPYHRNEDNAYDLYAVCNHHGSMQGGHYTAYCKNPVDGRWYLFDDTKVQAVQESDVVTADAYILFYQRSSLFAHSCASSSTSGYSTASSVSLMTAEHWAFRMPPFLHMVPKTSKSQDNLCDVASPSTLERRSKSENRPFVRSGKAYSSMSQFSDMKKISTCEFSESERHSDGEVHPDDIPPPPPPPSKRYWTITSV